MICRKCGVDKPLEEFSASCLRYSDHICMICHREKCRQYRLENKDRLRVTYRKWRLNHKEHERERFRKARSENKETIRERNRLSRDPRRGNDETIKIS